MPVASELTRSRYPIDYEPFFPAAFRAAPGEAPWEEFVAVGASRIHVDRWGTRPDGPVVVVVHGAGGHGRMLAPVGRMLAGEGAVVLAPDLPGYGCTDAPRGAPRFETWVEVVAEVARREVRGRPRPIVLFGASIGGLVAYNAACRLAAEGLAVRGLIATMLSDPREPNVRRELLDERWPLWLAGWPLRLAALAFANLRVPIATFTPMDRIANTPAVAQAVLADSLGGGARVPVGLLASLVEAAPEVEPQRFDVCPVLLAHPGADRWTSLGSSRAFFDRIRAPRELVLLDRCGHFPVEEPGLTQLGVATQAFLRRVVPT